MEAEASIVFGTLIVIGMALMPFYNAFIERMKMKKDETDQFHKRHNDALHAHYENKADIAYLKGFNDGLQRGKDEA